jgi:hypothetical protein
MTQLNGSAQPVPLGQGYYLRSPGVHGQAELHNPRTAEERSRGRAIEDGTASLDDAFAATNIVEIRQVDLRLDPISSDASRSLRSTDSQEMIELQVPDLGPETGQLVLSCDEAGVLSWHLPLEENQAVQRPMTRGAGGVKRFLVPATVPQTPAPSKTAGRGLLGVVGRKLLKVLVYPVADPILGPISEFFAERWEARNRPYGIRDFKPGEFRQPGGIAIGADDWRRLSAGRALMFIHGTFSTAHSAFGLVSDAAFEELNRHYDGRLFALNHPTLGDDPRKNVEWLFQQIPQSLPLELDIICHSRGGLVARTISEGSTVFDLAKTRVSVKRIAFWGVPNHGTLLAHPNHMVKMIDRLTTLLNLFPTGVVTETLEGLITAIKIIGHGALKGLNGLAAMNPEGDFLRALNQQAPLATEYFAIAADYSPSDEGVKALVAGNIANAVLDRVFERAANDLVVPELGVYSENGGSGFPIDQGRVLRIPASAGIMHTHLFSYKPAIEKVTAWLTGQN